jgi:hypothetical protein
VESITIIKTNADSPAGENSEQVYTDRPEKNSVKKMAVFSDRNKKHN